VPVSVLAVAVTHVHDRRHFAIRIGFASSVARTRQRAGKFLLQHLDEALNASARLGVVSRHSRLTPSQHGSDITA